MRRARIHTLSKIKHVEGMSFIAPLPDFFPPGDSPERPDMSTLTLFEGSNELTAARAQHSEIVAKGHGRYSHWGEFIYFSSSDGTSPKSNGRAYTVHVPGEAREDDLRSPIDRALKRLSDQSSPYDRFEIAESIFRALVPGVHLSEYGRSFFGNQEFASIYEKFAENNYRAYDRRFTLWQLALSAASKPAAMAECGVYRGATAYLMANAMTRHNPSSDPVQLFDSFEGLSSPIEQDGSYWKKGDMSVGLTEVRSNLEIFSQRIEYYPGWIPTRFADATSRKYSFVHLDVDLYQPTLDALEFFYERVVDGGFILCDDYGFESCPGARLAMDEFFETKPETIVHLPTGQGLVIRRG